MSISSIAGGQSVSQLMRTSFKPPSFESLDTNSDSSLTLDELKSSAPKGANAANSSSGAEALFKAMDADGDGKVTGSEKDIFDTMLSDQRQGMAFMTQQFAGPSNADIFSATDADGDGSVTMAEFSDDDAASGIDSDTLQKVFDLIDTDKNGSVSETESSDFLDAIKTAMDQGRPAGGPPPGGPPPGGPPPSSSASGDENDDGASSSATLLSMAQSAYKTTQQKSLLDQLMSIFDSAA